MKDSNKGNKTIIALVVGLLLLVVVVGVSYAYFSANVTGAESASTIKVTAGSMSITYAGGSNVTVSNIYPRTASWATKNFTVTGTNSTAGTMSYKLTLKVTNNTFSANALKYTLTGSKTNGDTGTVVNVSSQTGIATGSSNIEMGTGTFQNASGLVHTYALDIFFPDTGSPQNNDQGKAFAAYVLIEGVQ